MAEKLILVPLSILLYYVLGYASELLQLQKKSSDSIITYQIVLNEQHGVL